MALLHFTGIGITAMGGAVPTHIIDNYNYQTDFFGKENVKEVVDKIGVYQRRFADENTCSSDLCYAAADKMLNDNNIDRNEIDLLVFLSQTPDYRMPATSIILQNRLGIPMSCMAFDISLGCSGFCYALSIVYGMMQNHAFRKALILDGETRSKVYSKKDRREAFIFGDAGIAALVERNEKFGDSYFSLNSDGSRSELIMIPAGGYRHMSSPETLKEKVVDEFGNIRSDEHAYMRGGDVFQFVIIEVPKDIKHTLKVAEMTADQMDYIVFHQANNYINSFIAKKMKFDSSKIPVTIGKYGNTSSVSVPLTIVSELKDKMEGEKKILMTAFGVGMAWATAIVPFVDCKISEIVEVENGELVKR